MPEYLTVTTFGGLNRSDSLIVPINSPAANILKLCENFRGMVDLTSSHMRDPIIGMLCKSPQLENYAPSLPASGKARGMGILHSEDVTIFYILCFLGNSNNTSGTLYALDVANDTWKTLLTGISPFHMSFEQYGNKIYMTNGTAPRKWWHGDISWENCAPLMSDKGGTPIALTGNLTFTNGSTTVTGVGTNFTTELSNGYWIRKDSNDDWYEVKTITSNTGLTLTCPYQGTTGSGGSGNSQRAPTMAEGEPGFCPRLPLFLLLFKNKLWMACDIYSSNYFSRLFWSATGDPENWTGIGAGYIDVGNVTGESIITGLASLDDNLFVFKDTEYYVYRWTGDLDEPIVEVRRFNHGCVSPRTIQEVNNGLIYLSNNDLRWTNGNEDVSIAGSMQSYFQTSVGGARTFNYFSLTNYDDNYPWAIVDEYRKVYSLYLPTTMGNTYVLNYDYSQNQWIGTDYYYSAGHGVKFYGRASIPKIVFSKMNLDNQLISFTTYGGDVTTPGYLESATFYSGIASKKLKIHWVEFDFHPILGNGTVDTKIIFNYRKDFKKIDETKQQTYSLYYDLLSNLDRAYIVDTHRFPVNETCRYFSWYLTESFGSNAFEDFGIVSWTICYDIIDNP